MTIARHRHRMSDEDARATVVRALASASLDPEAMALAAIPDGLRASRERDYLQHAFALGVTAERERVAAPVAELPKAERAPLDVAHAKEFSEREEKRLSGLVSDAQNSGRDAADPLYRSKCATLLVDATARLEGYRQAMCDIFEALGAK